jgi:hypothetical protein
MIYIKKKMNGVILKIGIENADDKVKWSFLQQTLVMKHFSDEWRALIHNFFQRKYGNQSQ